MKRFRNFSTEDEMLSFEAKYDIIASNKENNKIRVCVYQVEPVPNNEIWYTSSTDQPIENFNNATLFGDGLDLVSNTYENGKGVAKYSGDVTKIGGSAFYGCKILTSVVIPNSVTSIEPYAFGYENLTSVTIGTSVTSIGSNAFEGCRGLNSVTIPNSVTTIDNAAFAGCVGLTSVTIGNSLTSIGIGAFSNCSGLANIIFNGTTVQWNSITKGNNWRAGVPARVVHCTDGDINL